MRKNILILAVALLMSTASFAYRNSDGKDTGNVEVIKYTFKLYKPATKEFTAGFLKLPGVIEYHIDSVGNCVLYSQPVNNLMYDISHAIYRNGYKFTDMLQETLTEAEYLKIKKDEEKTNLSPDNDQGTQKK